MSEDLVFFYQHVARGGSFSKVDDVRSRCRVITTVFCSDFPRCTAQEIMVYRHVASSASFALTKELLMQVRALPPNSVSNAISCLCDGMQL